MISSCIRARACAVILVLFTAICARTGHSIQAPRRVHIRSDHSVSETSAKTIRVAIVGGGIGGAIAAYTLKQDLGENVAVSILEAGPRVGGRLKHITLEGVALNVGGDVFSQVNPIMVGITKELNISLDGTGFDGNGLTGVYDGKNWWKLDKNLLQEAAAGIMLQLFKGHLSANYRDRTNPFTTISEYTHAGTLDTYTSETMEALLKNSGINYDFQFRNVQPLTRSIYDQTVELNAFAGIASLLSATTNTWSATGGNDVMVQDIIKASKASLYLNTTVAKVTQLAGKGAGYNISFGSSGGPSNPTFDQVIIAAPLEFANIEFDNLNLGFCLYHVRYRYSVTFTPRSYNHWYVSMVAATKLSPTYFGVDPVPDYVVTPQNSTTPFAVITVQAKLPSGLYVYKMFSNTDLSDQFPSIFIGVNTSYVEHWPYTFPDLSPVPKNSEAAPDHYQPVVLAPGLFYTASMESVAVAMECAAVAGQNAAKLVSEQARASRP